MEKTVLGNIASVLPEDSSVVEDVKTACEHDRYVKAAKTNAVNKMLWEYWAKEIYDSKKFARLLEKVDKSFPVMVIGPEGNICSLQILNGRFVLEQGKPSTVEQLHDMIVNMPPALGFVYKDKLGDTLNVHPKKVVLTEDCLLIYFYHICSLLTVIVNDNDENSEKINKIIEDFCSTYDARFLQECTTRTQYAKDLMQGCSFFFDEEDYEYYKDSILIYSENNNDKYFITANQVTDEKISVCVTTSAGLEYFRKHIGKYEDEIAYQIFIMGKKNPDMDDGVTTTINEHEPETAICKRIRKRLAEAEFISN